MSSSSTLEPGFFIYISRYVIMGRDRASHHTVLGRAPVYTGWSSKLSASVEFGKAHMGHCKGWGGEGPLVYYDYDHHIYLFTTGRLLATIWLQQFGGRVSSITFWIAQCKMCPGNTFFRNQINLYPRREHLPDQTLLTDWGVTITRTLSRRCRFFFPPLSIVSSKKRAQPLLQCKTRVWFPRLLLASHKQ